MDSHDISWSEAGLKTAGSWLVARTWKNYKKRQKKTKSIQQYDETANDKKGKMDF